GLEFLHEPRPDLLRRDPRGNRQLALSRAGTALFPNRHRETLAEGVETGLVQRDADGHRVTAPACQVLGAGPQHLNEIDAVDAATRTLGEFPLVAEDHAGAVVLARHPARNDADHARMPRLPVQHDSGGVRVVLFDHRLGLLRDLALDVLPLAVEGVEL